MAAPLAAQARLDQVVKTIARGFSSEVCSVYLLRAGDILELFASEGLNPDSVHLTRLSTGEGLVGDIAATAQALNLAEASMHPKFVYRPETGEEIYHSFVGVPILQAGRTIGVLVVQGKEAQVYSQEQLEVLQTVAMVLSELAISNQFVSLSELESTASAAIFSQRRMGLRLSGGMSVAPAVMFEARRSITQLVASDPQAEQARLATALERLQELLERLIEEARQAERMDEHDILEAHLLLTHDKGWRGKIVEAIASGLTAEAAVRKTEEELRARMAQISNPYIRERVKDMEDISNRLISQLLGDEGQALLPERYILVARGIGPAEMLDLDTRRVCGLVLEEGSSSSHTAVVARALDLPVLAGVERASSIIVQGDILVLDADAGELHIRPSEEALAVAAQKLLAMDAKRRHYASFVPLPAMTRDGVRISLNINSALHVPPEALAQEGVDGIGLYRTELPYMAATHFPSVESQVGLYRSVLEESAGKRVIFRTLDIGSDKTVPYFRIKREENPAMGWRGARIGIDRPLMLREQFSALLQAADGRELWVMFPFISHIYEVEFLKELFKEEQGRLLRSTGKAPMAVKIGVMLEIPSLLWQLPEVLKAVDFLSIGSNDLLQFFFACDRGSEAVAERFDALSPVALRMIAQVAEACELAKVELSFCGEMAGRPLEALALIGCGVKSLSMPAASTLPVKEMLRSLDLAVFKPYLAPLLQTSLPSLRSRLQEYALDHGVVV